MGLPFDWLGQASQSATEGALKAAADKPITINLELQPDTRAWMSNALIGAGVVLLMFAGIMAAGRK